MNQSDKMSIEAAPYQGFGLNSQMLPIILK
jgi:hypothetical protein